MAKFHVIKDPVHGVMQFSSEENRWIKPFIDHPYFQRLRNVKQSGLADLIFPGAVHTRLNHGMGCCYVGSQIASKIGLSDSDRQLVSVACLLHDVGHGPFSHAFEDLFVDKAIRHECWTPYFLNEFNTQNFFDAYNRNNPDLPFDENKLIEVQQMIMHEHPNKLISDIVSSQIDADRFDYLLRDSHFCGVKYGEFDLRWMMHCLTPIETERGTRLGVTYKGVGVVEHYLMARRLMIKNIYHHAKKQAIEMYLVTLLSMLSTHIETEKFLTHLRPTALGKLLININQFNQQVATSKDKQALIKTFMDDNYSLYKQLADIHVLMLIGELASYDLDHDIVKLAKKINNRRLPEIYPIDNKHIETIKQLLSTYKEENADTISDWQCGIAEIPQLSYTGDDDAIYVQEKNGQIVSLKDKSFMIRVLSDQYEHASSLYVDQEILVSAGFQTLLAKIHKISAEEGLTA